MAINLTISRYFTDSLEKMAATKQKYSPSNGNELSNHKPVKILIVGDYEIGKTSIIETYLYLKETPEEENAFERYRARIKYEENEVDFEIFDLSPGVTAPQRRKLYPTGVNAVLLCFSIGVRDSLVSVYNLWVHEVRAHYGKLVPIFLVGLRSDMRHLELYVSGTNIPPGMRLVEKSEAEMIHKKCRFHGDYMECSKYDRRSIVNVINKAFYAAMKH